ncbi:MAG: protein-L-isoaspartate O-methyltransferase [Candidatus Marinimicrobia bacterium]|nr:protein-L-isoaspartate O-methyltransferase [Candidatus Neomarinimicrobiota bacterium]
MDFDRAREKMVASQIRTSEVTDPLVIDAMGCVPREKFLPIDKQNFAYLDEDLFIGNGRFVMEPLVVARLIQLAELEAADSVLVIGAGTGYLAAVVASMADAVVALESDSDLAGRAVKIYDELGIKNVKVIVGDLKSGFMGAFDAVIVDGAVEMIPDQFRNQLKEGGRLACVVREGPVGRATLVKRAGDSYGSRQEFDAMTPCLPGFEKQRNFVF